MAGASVSVGGLFMAGVVPGILLTLGFMALASFLSHRRRYPLSGEPFRLRNVLRQARKALIIIMMPVIVIGGIVGGVFTATEGSAIAVVYALVVGFFVTRRLTLADLPGVLLRAAITSAMFGALIAFASAVTFLLTVDLLPQKLSVALQALTTDPLVFNLLVALLHPVALAYGIEPLHFGLLFVLNLVFGMLTPPVGVVLFVVCGITGVKMSEMVKAVWPFIAWMCAILFACMFYPPL